MEGVKVRVLPSAHPKGREGRENPEGGHHAQIPQPRGLQAPLLEPGLTMASNRSSDQAPCRAQGPRTHCPPSSPCYSSQDPRDRCLCLPVSVAPESHNCPGLSHTGKPDRLHPCSRHDVEASGWSSWVRSPSTGSQLWPESGWRTLTVRWSPQRGLLQPVLCVPRPHPPPLPGPRYRSQTTLTPLLGPCVAPTPPEFSPALSHLLAFRVCAGTSPAFVSSPDLCHGLPLRTASPTDVSGRLRLPGLRQASPSVPGELTLLRAWAGLPHGRRPPVRCAGYCLTTHAAAWSHHPQPGPPLPPSAHGHLLRPSQPV